MDYPAQNGTIDSHFHGLIMAERGVDANALFDRLDEAGFGGGIDVSTSPEDLGRRMDLHTGRPRVLLSSGVHPGNCGRADTAPLIRLLDDQLHDDAVRPRISAVGEMGLDWYRGQEYRAEQISVFEAQLALARREELPVIIHNRDADDDVLACLDANPGVTGVMHCFSSSRSFAVECLDRGFMISFAGNVTYKRSEGIREAARSVPNDRLLLETDAPFLAPQVMRGKTNHPGYVRYVYDFVAQLRGVAVEALIDQVARNFHALFRR